MWRRIPTLLIICFWAVIATMATGRHNQSDSQALQRLSWVWEELHYDNFEESLQDGPWLIFVSGQVPETRFNTVNGTVEKKSENTGPSQAAVRQFPEFSDVCLSALLMAQISGGLDLPVTIGHITCDTNALQSAQSAENFSSENKNLCSFLSAVFPVLSPVVFVSGFEYNTFDGHPLEIDSVYEFLLANLKNSVYSEAQPTRIIELRHGAVVEFVGYEEVGDDEQRYSMKEFMALPATFDEFFSTHASAKELFGETNIRENRVALNPEHFCNEYYLKKRLVLREHVSPQDVSRWWFDTPGNAELVRRKSNPQGVCWLPKIAIALERVPTSCHTVNLYLASVGLVVLGLGVTLLSARMLLPRT